MRKLTVVLILTNLLIATTPALAGKPLAGFAVDYQAQGATYEGYYVDAGKNAPLVIIAHDWDGLTEYEVKRALMLAEIGYSVYAMDLFGKGIRPTKMEDRRQHTGELYQDRTKMRAIMEAAIASAAKQGANISNAVAIGYCFGGAAILELARSGKALQGFVSIHGGLATPEGQNYSKTQGQILIQHGAADANISMQDFAQLATELEQAKLTHEMIAYGGAPHAWTVFGGERYRELADKRAWASLLSFLDEVLVAPKADAGTLSSRPAPQ